MHRRQFRRLASVRRLVFIGLAVVVALATLAGTGSATTRTSSAIATTTGVRAMPTVVSHCTTTTQAGIAVQHCLNVTSSQPIHQRVRTSSAAIARSAPNRLTTPAATSEQGGPQIVPAVCAELGVSNPDRFTTCSLDQWTITETQDINGVTTVVGQLPFQVSAGITYSIESGPVWGLGVVVLGDVPSGTLAAGVTGTMETGCAVESDTCQTTSGSEGQPIAITQNSSTASDWEQKELLTSSVPNALTVLNGGLGVVLNLTGSSGDSVQINDAAADTLTGRCDGIITPVECVNQFGPMAVVFDSTQTPLVADVAQNIWSAEANNAPNPLPTRWRNPFFTGTALSRDMNASDQTLNNTAACANVPLGPGQNCDEYPMASTHQGVFFVGAGNFRAVAVSEESNDSQGGTLNTFYTEFHVLDTNNDGEDQFFVNVVLPDGTTAW